MANYTNLKNIIDQYITTNGQGDITGAILNDVLKNIVDSIGADFLFAGVAEPTTNPGSPDQNVFYIAIKGGTYTNFGNVVIPNGITIFQWNGSWYNKILFAGDGGVFDITAYHNGTKYADLTAALGISGANVPQSLRKGGMSVKFVHSYDNKYVQYFLTKNTWSAAEGDWVKVNLEEELKIIESTIYGIVDTDISYNVTTGTSINTSTASSGATRIDIPAGTEIKIKVSGTAQISTTKGFTAYLKKADGTTNVDTIEFAGQTEVTYTPNEDVAYIGFYCLGSRIESNGTLVFTVEYLDDSSVNTRLAKLEDICDSVKYDRVALNSVVDGYYIYKTGEWLSNQYFRVEIYPVIAGRSYYIDVDYNNTYFALCAFYSSVPTAASTPISKIAYTEGISKYVEIPQGASYVAISLNKELPKINRVFDTSNVKKVVDKLTDNLYFPDFENRGKSILYVGDSISTSYYWREFLRDDFGLKIVSNNVSMPASVGGIPLIPPITETTGLESIWWRCASNRLINAGYSADIISLLGGFNDIANSDVPVGTKNDVPFVDNSSDFDVQTTDTRPETLTFCAALKGCILMLKRDFPNAQIIVPTIMYCTGRGTNQQSGDSIILSEKVALRQVEIAQLYGLRFVPWYWSERSANTISAFSSDGVHPSVAGARVMERWFAQYLPLF